MKSSAMKRRRFLKRLGLLSASLAAVSNKGWANIIIPSSRQDRKLGVALVGLGYYSTDLLAPALQHTNLCELRGIVTGSPEKIPVWQKRYGIKDSNIYNYGNMPDIASNDDIDVVYIVLPPGLHARYSIVAANAGKQVWCEKPMAKTEAECQSIIDACRSNKVMLSIGYRMQHEPNTQTLIRWADEKPFGKVQNVTAEAGYFDSRTTHWKQNKELGGGAMYDMGVYPLNAARYTTGEEPVAVTARHSTKRPEVYDEVDETTYFNLEFPSGATAACVTSLGMSMNSLRVNAEQGWYGLTPFQSYSGIRGNTSDGRALAQKIPNQQARQMDDDARAITNGSRMLVPGEEGLLDIRIVEAIYRSAKEGRRITIS